MAKPDLYDDFMMDHIKNARNYRVLDDAHCTASATNPLCGDELTLYLKLEGERIAALSYQCSCCGISMASASMMTEHLTGKRMEEAHRIVAEVTAFLKYPAQPMPAQSTPAFSNVLQTLRRYPARTACAALAWTALGPLLAARVPDASSEDR